MRETPDFVDAKRRIQETIKDSNIIDVAKIKNNPVWQEKVNKKTDLLFFNTTSTTSMVLFCLYSL
ncbi:hypothetical protein ACE5D9_03300 [Rickettsia sp. 2024-CO-Wats]|uniref:hypothetical protein n=1 Tax=unclassified Rickettsia TaxID=114295 RepID=UPI00370DD966